MWGLRKDQWIPWLEVDHMGSNWRARQHQITSQGAGCKDSMEIRCMKCFYKNVDDEENEKSQAALWAVIKMWESFCLFLCFFFFSVLERHPWWLKSRSELQTEIQPSFTNIIHSLMHLNPHFFPFSSSPKDKDIKILSLSFLHESQEYQNSTDWWVNWKVNSLEVPHTRAFSNYLLIQSSPATLETSLLPV